jgi:cytochrome c biogenesis protein CcdA
MIELLAVLTPIALLNSVVILPGGIIGIIASLGARKPILTASAFIAGQFLPHFAFGLLLAFGVDTAFDQANVWLQDTWRDPNIHLVLLQLVIGGAMVLFSYRLSRASQHRPDNESSKLMTPVGAFSVAAGLTITKLPGALLYFAAIDQILRAYPTVLGIVTALLYYNLTFLLPLMLIVLARRLFGTRTDPILAAVSRFFERRGKRLMFFGFLVLGTVLVVDAVGWFLGFPLLPTYFL